LLDPTVFDAGQFDSTQVPVIVFDFISFHVL